MSNKFAITWEQMVIRVKDMYDLSTLNTALDEGWRIANTCIMQFGVVKEKTVGGYIDYILEKEVVDDEESFNVPSPE